MEEKRRNPRLIQENAVTLKIIPVGKQQVHKKVLYHLSKDISASGARIRADTFLPVGSRIKIQLTLNDPVRMITALGKIKWTRSLYGDDSCEAGVEFVDTPVDVIEQLADYVSKTNKE